jgi:fatty-acyl-CoA synthase
MVKESVAEDGFVRSYRDLWVWKEGMEHFGDLGYFDEEGYLYVVDRVKDVINTGGIQVSGSEVEEVLFQHEAVSEVAVLGLPDEEWIEAVSAVVVPRKDAETENLREEFGAGG